MTRYLLVVNVEGGVCESPMEEWKPEDVTAHLDYYRALHRELVENGELVESEVLAGPDLAKIVTSNGGALVRHGLTVPGVQGVGGRLPDRRRRV